ncbi:exosortase family protein XrtF [Formosa sp. PL04]|uniref:exosortase family protein XrtF n=1 Tax=Formosa sp. PL04 TaxID=3081755 RepID=UPI002981E292|nr:exosortase family protein XrtF [Formosa sp. PL04]MDW5287516.1 exosortase family protein XrtF [Formosa sp. PL04]
MATLFKTYKPVIRFIVTFLVVYFVMSLGYKWYLDYSKTTIYQPDYLTYQVAKQSQDLLNVAGFDSKIELHEGEPWVRFLLNGDYIVRIIEGCNAISVIILFIAFIVAFAASFKNTVLFIIAGAVLIYIVNVARIAVLTLGLYYYPDLEHILHGVVFPLIIYGMVFLLWVIWVNYFVKIKKKDAEHSTL